MGELDVEVRKSSAGEDTARELLEFLVESVTDYAIFMLDPRGHVRTWNAGARRIKGYEASEIIGQHFSAFYTPEDRARGKPQAVLKTASDEGRYEEEGWRVRKDGSRFWASVVVNALRRDGELIGFAKITRDLTERKAAEEERGALLAREQQARQEAERAADQLRALQHVTEAALGSLSLDDLLNELLSRIRDVLRADTAAILLLQGSELVATAAKGIEEEVEQGVRVPVGAGFAGKIAAERQPVVIDHVDHADILNPILQQKGIHSLAGVPLVVHDDVLGVLHVGSLTHRPFSADDVRLLQAVGDRAAMAIEHARLVAAYQDVSALRELDRQRDAFLSAAAHDLKTPLSGIQGQVQLLARRLGRVLPADLDGAVRKTIEEPLGFVQTATTKMTRLIDAVLDVARLEMRSQLELHRRSADLITLLRGITDEYQTLFPSHALRVVSEIPELVGCWDDERLERVFSNLVGNAVKYSPNGGDVLVSVAKDEQQGGAVAVVEVQDHGLGIPAKDLPNIFERFRRGENVTGIPGTGIGLAYARSVVQQHGGQITVSSDQTGTIFKVALPLGGSGE